MFKYAVRVATERGRVSASLVDWPEVVVEGRGDPLRDLKAELLEAIGECVRTQSPVRVPKTKAKSSSPYLVRLSAREAMKVIVFNEMIAARLNYSILASKLGVDEGAVRRALDLGEPADVDSLERILKVMGKCLLAYTAAC